VKDENGDLLADSHNILNMWKNYFPQFFTVRRVSDARQIEIHTDLELLFEPHPSEVLIDIVNLKEYKSPGSKQIKAEVIQAGGKTFQIHKLINSICNKQELDD
jgi:hypothetical protein